MKICLTFSGGGHLIEAMNACKFLLKGQHSIYFVTYRPVKYSGDIKIHYVTHPKHCFFIKRFLLFVANFCQSFIVFLKERPALTISTGADVTVSSMLIAKGFKTKLIFIESGANVSKPSSTGRIAYHFADLFIVQWEELMPYYPNAIYGGPLL